MNSPPPLHNFYSICALIISFKKLFQGLNMVVILIDPLWGMFDFQLHSFNHYVINYVEEMVAFIT